jgi:MFS superfamily sulfate permease-like transporter
LTIAMTQLPSLIGTAGGGPNFFERALLGAGQLGGTRYPVLAVGMVAILLLVLGGRWHPGKPVALGVVALSIVAALVLGLPAFGVPTTGEIPPVLPPLEFPALRLGDVEGIVPLAGRGIALRIVGAHGRARDLLRADGIDEKVGGLGSGRHARRIARHLRRLAWPYR